MIVRRYEFGKESYNPINNFVSSVSNGKVKDFVLEGGTSSGIIHLFYGDAVNISIRAGVPGIEDGISFIADNAEAYLSSIEAFEKGTGLNIKNKLRNGIETIIELV